MFLNTKMHLVCLLSFGFYSRYVWYGLFVCDFSCELSVTFLTVDLLN